MKTTHKKLSEIFKDRFMIFYKIFWRNFSIDSKAGSIHNYRNWGIYITCTAWKWKREW